ncbi:unnamed protein product, partial [Musa textilis]
WNVAGTAPTTSSSAHMLLPPPHPLPPRALRHVSLPLCPCVFPPHPRCNHADVSLATLPIFTCSLLHINRHPPTGPTPPPSPPRVDRVSLLPIFGDRFFDTLFPTMPTSLDHKMSRPVVRMNRIRRRRLPLLKRSRICYDIDGRRKQSPAAAAVATGAVKERLRALRKLIPRKTDSVKEKETATDRIFEETAEYILLLRAQVEVLKLLVDFHSPCMEKNGGMQ